MFKTIKQRIEKAKEISFMFSKEAEKRGFYPRNRGSTLYFTRAHDFYIRNKWTQMLNT